MSRPEGLIFNPDFVDFDAYSRGVYTPPPQLVALADADPFWSTFGGSLEDPFGCGGETFRQRRAAAELGITAIDRLHPRLNGAAA